MGNFTGSYRYIRDARIFPGIANQAAMVALETAAQPNRAFIGDLAVRTDLDNQWFRMTAFTPPAGAPGDWTALEVWEAGLVPVNAIPQFPGLTTVQAVMDDCVSGVTAGAGNPFNIQSDATHDVIAGPTAGLGQAPPANGSVIALGYVLSDGGIGLANYLTPVIGDVIGTNNVVADAGYIQAGHIVTAAPNSGDIVSAARVIGEAGIQPGVTAGDLVITRLIPFTVACPPNGALAANVTQGNVADANAAVGDMVIQSAAPHAQAVGVAALPLMVTGAGQTTWTLVNTTGAPANYPGGNYTGLYMRTVVI